MVFVYARPDADTSTGSWKNESGGAVLFSAVDETSLDDADYIISAPNTFNDACKLSLSDVGIAGTPSTVRYRYRKYEGDASTVMGLHVELLQGSTVIAEWDHDDIGTSFVTAEQTLTTPQFNSITDFRDLYLSFTTAAWWLTGSSIDLDLQNGRTWDGVVTGTDFTTFLSCSRASVGYARNSDGTLTSFATNTLRIGNGSGLLIEDARTNLMIRSQEFDIGAVWNPVQVTITANTTTAPDGTSTADSVVANGTSNQHYAQSLTAPIPNSTTITLSVYAKANTANFINFLIEGANIYAQWNLSTGALVFSGAGTGTLISAPAGEALAGGWWRFGMTFSQATGTTRNFRYYPLASSQNVANPSETSTASMYLWGVQVEAAAFASSYIPTTTASATRAADNITTSSTLQSTINAATGSLVAQTDLGGGAGFAANIVDSNATNLLGFNAFNNALASMIGALATANTANRTTQDKLGLAWSPSGRSLVLNGGTVATDASAQTPSATQHIGSSGTANFAFAYVERVTAWTTKLADATLQGFTT